MCNTRACVLSVYVLLLQPLRPSVNTQAYCMLTNVATVDESIKYITKHLIPSVLEGL